MNKLLKGASLVLAINVVGQVIVYLVQAVLARLLGVESYGTYIYVYSWIPILLIPSLLGFDTASIRFLPAYTSTNDWMLAKGLYFFSQQIVGIASITIAIILGLTVYFLGLEQDLLLTFWAACLLLPIWAQFRLFHGVLQAFNHITYSQFLLTIVRPLALIVISIVIYLVQSGSIGSATIMSGQIFVMLVLVFAAWRIIKRVTPKELFVPERSYTIRQWMRVSLPLSLVSGMRILLNSIDIILVGILLGTVEAGIYSVASRVANVLVFGLSASNSVVAPKISELYERKELESLQDIVVRASWFSTISVVCLGLMIFFGSDYLLGAFGEKFVAGRSILLILGIAQVVNAATGPVGYLLNMTGYQDVNLKILAVIIILNLIFNYPAILAWNAVGAAVVTATLSITKNIWTWFEVRNRLNINSSIIPLNIKISVLNA